MKLNILICSLPERSQQLERLTRSIDRQIEPFKGDVAYVVNSAVKHIPTGTKRNQLISNTNAEYFVFIDDDDTIDDQYLSLIMTAIESKPDVVTFNGHMTTNGASLVDFIIKLHEKYEARKDADNITRYYRFPNHICVMRREAVQSVKFPDIWQGEDYKWAKEIHDRKLLKTEVHIDKNLYHYDFKTKK